MKPQLVNSLCSASVKRQLSPYIDFHWPDKVDWNAWYFSPELISIYSTPAYAALSESAQKKLSFYEAVNFFSLNIHGEKPLIQGLADRLYADRMKEVTAYLHHFLDEENDHMVYFGGFCQRYAGKVYRDRKLEFPREYLEGEEDFLFFLKVMIFEEIVDFYNIKMGSDDRLEECTREINRRHHLDEARHLAFGRNFTRDLFHQYKDGWGEAKVAELREYIPNYMLATWKEYYNPEVYEDAGLENSYDLVEEAFHAPASAARRNEITSSCIKYLLDNEILLEAPKL